MLKFLENMEAEPDKDHNESRDKDMGPSCNFLHVGINSPQNTCTQGYKLYKHNRVSEWISRGTWGWVFSNEKLC